MALIEVTYRDLKSSQMNIWVGEVEALQTDLGSLLQWVSAVNKHKVNEPTVYFCLCFDLFLFPMFNLELYVPVYVFVYIYIYKQLYT